MRLNLPCITAFVALLCSSVAGFGQRFRFARELQLAAEFGLDADKLLEDRQEFRTIEEYDRIPAEYISLPIDHDDPSVGTFQNRFWANDEYYKPGGPVIVYDAGETNAGSSANHLTSEYSFFPGILEEFGAIGVVWEHRYYGNSLPYPVANDTPPEHFKYLTTKQALADIPVFAENFTRPRLQQFDLTPVSTPWVMLGGSYAGSRVAFARNMYPDTIFASFASSAPVQAQVNMSVYYEQVYRAMVANGWTNCAKDIHSALEYIDEQLSQEDTAASIKKLFLGDGAEQNSNEDFTAALSIIYEFFQSRGFDESSGSLGEFCQWLELDHETGESSGPDGFAPSLGKQHVVELWATWPQFVNLVNIFMETNCQMPDIPDATCTLNARVTDPDSIAWSWQYCSEWGFYQSNNVGAHSLLSRYQTPEFQQVMCNRQFPEALERGLLPSEPQADAVNEEFGGWSIRPSNVYWTAGEFDPWRTLSPLSNEESSPQVNVTSEIPQCGVQTAANTVFGYIGDNEYHCFDFNAASSLGETSRGYFRQALKEWLPCFGK
ncbi:putative serine peptidase, family S28 [Aspergillus undulatus]|uniref:putative serine peptidase, family S28 n=1 Tax=Aspergillus undulatus TaxID=1810928 RepID=UPI003CCE4A79